MYGAYASDQTGRALSTAGDINGDGIDDIIIGVSQATNGRTYIIYGRTLSENIDLRDAPGAGLGFTITGTNGDYKLGNSVAALGDVNGDGLSDVIVGAPYTDLNNDIVQDAGMCVVLFGRNVTAGAPAFTNIHLTNWITNSTNGFRIFGSQASGQAGFTVGGGGDINGDGMNDILIGALGMDRMSNLGVGAVFVVFGRNTFSDIQLSEMVSGAANGLVIYGEVAGDWLSAYAVDFAGDVNHDGVADIIVGAYKAAPAGNLDAGMGYVVYGVPPEPTSQPSRQPSAQPSSQPSRQPSSQPSCQPSKQPTSQPSYQPSRQPSTQPSRQPSSQPSRQPSSQPSMQPSARPSGQPTHQPSTQPTQQPLAPPSSQPSAQPTYQPSSQPSTHPTRQPSSQPSVSPSRQPSAQPTIQPTRQPSSQLSVQPSSQPTTQPTAQPLTRPSGQPSAQPIAQPSSQPSARPSNQPTTRPTSTPSGQPSTQPSRQPKGTPTGQPTISPTTLPSAAPSTQPSSQPTCQPSVQPSSQPYAVSSELPLHKPTAIPTSKPSNQPSSQPTKQSVGAPSAQPSAQPTGCPSVSPSRQPSSQPSLQPSAHPIYYSTIPPTPQPSLQPSLQPSVQPTRRPTAEPTIIPTTQPSSVPNGEWAVILDSVSAMQAVEHIGSDLWMCSADTGMCTTVGAELGTIIAEYAFPWATTVHVSLDSASGGVIISGTHTTSGQFKESMVARCAPEPTSELLCKVYTFSAVAWVAASTNTDYNKIVHIGSSSSSTAIATIFDTITNMADSYTYTSNALKSITLHRVQSIPNFVGSVLVGTCVTNTAVPQNCIYVGWVRVDTGTVDAMYLTPITGTIRNTVALVTSLAVEPLGPDSFIAGELELSDGTGMHVYIVRVNTLYRSVKYGMRYRIRATTSSGTSSGNRRTLTETSALESVVSATLLLNSNLYLIINYTNTNNISSIAVLQTNVVNGGIVKQVHLSATGVNLHCSDITVSGLFIAIACTATYPNSSQAVLLSVNKELSFTKLPVGFIKHTTYAATAESVPFRATVLTMSTQRTSVTMSTHQQVISDERTVSPTPAPSVWPTLRPSVQPLSAPSGQPSSSPSAAPSVSPLPTSHPSSSGPTNTYKPTVKATQRPSTAPTKVSTMSPSVSPSIIPTARPTVQPSTKPSAHPCAHPSVLPSLAPMVAPTKVPVSKPTKRPISLRTRGPTCVPTTLNHTAYVDSVDDNGRNGTVIAVTAAGAVVGGGLLLILLCAWGQYRRVEKRKKRKAAKGGEVTTMEANAAAEACADDSDYSVILSSLHSSERSDISVVSASYRSDSPSQSSHAESEMSWKLRQSGSSLFSSVHSGTDFSGSDAE